MTTVKALLDVYISLGGALTDTYPSIADGAPVSDYTLIPDAIAAISEQAKSSGGDELFVIDITRKGYGQWQTTKTALQIEAAVEADKSKIMFKISGLDTFTGAEVYIHDLTFHTIEQVNTLIIDGSIIYEATREISSKKLNIDNFVVSVSTYNTVNIYCNEFSITKE
jgi:hypothetical protein